MRRDSFNALYSSGRWRRYYTEDEVLQCLRDVARLCDRWGAIVEQMRSNLLPKVSADRRERRSAA